MFGIVRRYRVRLGTVTQAARHVEDALLPQLRMQQGFVAYYLLDAGAEILVSVTICETEPSGQSVARLAHDWFRSDWPSFRSIPPEASTGAVLAHAARQSAGRDLRAVALDAARPVAAEPRGRPDRRTGTDRRTGRVRRRGIERRQALLPVSLERRRGSDRRAVADRRTSGERRSGHERRVAWAAARARLSGRGDARWHTGEQRRTPSPDMASSE